MFRNDKGQQYCDLKRPPTQNWTSKEGDADKETNKYITSQEKQWFTAKMPTKCNKNWIPASSRYHIGINLTT